MQEISKEIILTFIACFGVMLSLSVFFVLFTYRYQKNIHAKEKELFNSIILAQEAEQERIARDLHDNIGPLLSIVRSQIASIDEDNLNEIDRKIKVEVVEQLGNAINDARNIAHNLLPKTFREYGFLKSVTYYLLKVKEYNHIIIDFKCDNWPNNVEENHETALFCIIQEMVQNTFNHANATKIVLEITLQLGGIKVVYYDDGKGFSTNIEEPKGMGLKNIEKRVNFIGGKYKLDSKLGKGTRFEFNFPFR